MDEQEGVVEVEIKGGEVEKERKKWDWIKKKQETKKSVKESSNQEKGRWRRRRRNNRKRRIRKRSLPMIRNGRSQNRESYLRRWYQMRRTCTDDIILSFLTHLQYILNHTLGVIHYLVSGPPDLRHTKGTTTLSRPRGTETSQRRLDVGVMFLGRSGPPEP